MIASQCNDFLVYPDSLTCGGIVIFFLSFFSSRGPLTEALNFLWKAMLDMFCCDGNSLAIGFVVMGIAFL